MSWPAGPDASSQINSLAAAQWELAAIGPVASAAEPARVLDFANAAAIISFNEGSSSAGETRAPTLECGMMAAAMAVTDGPYICMAEGGAVAQWALSVWVLRGTSPF